MIKVSIIFGTRPEVIKFASLIKAFQERKEVALSVCFTGQHREMVLPLLEFFEIPVHYALDIMQSNQSLALLSSRAMSAVESYLEEVKPDIVFVQGDTTTAMVAATAAFYRKIKIGHVEAGLRTNNMNSPFPEEFNRQVISKIANLHFAPTTTSFNNLKSEGVSEECIFLTGNTVIDTLMLTQEKVRASPEKYKIDLPVSTSDSKIILITGHRRENFGDGFENICEAIRKLAIKYPKTDFIYPVHLNPNVQEPVQRLLNGLQNVHLLPPMGYIEFTMLMEKSFLILTDSGGIQEEAPSLGKPVLIMRDTTERQEAVQAGAAILVGTKAEDIFKNAVELMENPIRYKEMSSAGNPFGKGVAAKMIVDVTMNYFS